MDKQALTVGRKARREAVHRFHRKRGRGGGLYVGKRALFPSIRDTTRMLYRSVSLDAPWTWKEFRTRSHLRRPRVFEGIGLSPFLRPALNTFTVNVAHSASTNRTTVTRILPKFRASAFRVVYVVGVVHQCTAYMAVNGIPSKKPCS